MWPDGYYYQRQLLYNYRWTREMEHTFVDTLLDHARHGQFHHGRENKHAVLCALRAVVRAHDCKVTTAWVMSRVKKLQERYEVFNWLIHRPDVVWNRQFKFVTASDSAWEEILQEEKGAKYYINAYEDMFEDLCVLFGEPLPNEEVVVPVPPAPAPFLAEEVVPPPVVVDLENEAANGDAPVLVPANVVNILSDSSDSNGSFWKVIEEYYASDSETDSVVAIPGVPTLGSNTQGTGDLSPNYHSQGPASSSASNATPLKKET